MEKLRPTHDLQAVQRVFSTVEGLALTGTALGTAITLGFDRQSIVDVIQTIQARHFRKSMTSYADHRAWQVSIMCRPTPDCFTSR